MTTTKHERPSGKSIRNLVLGAAAGIVGVVMPNVGPLDELLMAGGCLTAGYYIHAINAYLDAKLPAVEEPKKSSKEKAELEKYLEELEEEVS